MVHPAGSGKHDETGKIAPVFSPEQGDGTANEGTDYGFAVFSADKQELVDKFNTGLANIKASGKYDEILKKYLGK